MWQSIPITLLVILNALFPKKRSGAQTGLNAGIALPSDIPRDLANLGEMIGADGKLEFFIPGCAPLAAPFLLFRLKREGYSACRAVASIDGLRITARR